MTATQLRERLNALRLTQTAAARMLGLTDRTLRRYCAGDSPVPKTVELALQAIQKSPISVA